MHESLTPAPSNFAPDRGPAKYFHGREEILSTFGKILNYSTENRWGTTFLIQGAPGAGKTALLYECDRLAQESKWETTEISSAALWDPNELQQSLKLRRTWKVGGGRTSWGLWLWRGGNQCRKISPDRKESTPRE